MWRNSIGKVQVINKIDQFITLLIDNRCGFTWAITSVYTSLVPTVRELFWKYMKEFDELDNLSWVLIGDFNQILTYDEK